MICHLQVCYRNTAFLFTLFLSSGFFCTFSALGNSDLGSFPAKSCIHFSIYCRKNILLPAISCIFLRFSYKNPYYYCAAFFAWNCLLNMYPFPVLFLLGIACLICILSRTFLASFERHQKGTKTAPKRHQFSGFRIQISSAR